MSAVTFFENYSSNSIVNSREILSVFNTKKKKSVDIQYGMTVDQISDIVSDRVMSIVKKQFQETKDRVQAQLK